MRAPRACLLLLLAAVAAVGATAQAAEETALADVVFRPVVWTRTGAPAWVDVEFDTRATGLLEGCLEVTISNGLETVAQYRSDDMALTAGKQTFRLMLPPVSLPTGRGETTASAAFRTREGRYRFAPRPLSLPAEDVREFVICVATSEAETRFAAGGVASSLRLEGYDPESAPANTRTYATHVDRMNPQELPASPLTYCCFDILVLPDDGFARLQARQLDALRQWVEGGGSLCLLPRGGLKGYHEQFLNDLAGGSEGLFHLGPTGDVEAGGVSDGIVMFRPGLGRAVVVLPDAQVRLDTASPSWRRAVAFLWKLRREQAELLVNDGHWQTQKPNESAQWQRYEDRFAPPGSFRHVLLGATAAMQRSLMPEGVRTVPAGVLLLAFAAFVAAIGPFDYLLLGRLRKRAYTWLLFPALSVGFGGLVVYLSEHYMGSQDHVGAFVFVDVDRGGRVLRWSRCEMTYAGSAHAVQTRVQNALYAPLGEAVSSHDWRWNYDHADEAVSVYAGRLPFDFVLTRQISQWKPTFSRAISFEPPPATGRLNWQSLAGVDVSTHRGLALAAERLCAGVPFDGCVLRVSGEEISPIRGGDKGLFPRTPYASGYHEVSDFLREVSARPSQGVFSVVSQLSPGGPATLEDLSILDSTDPAQRLLIAVERVGTDYYVYRCLFRGED